MARVEKNWNRSGAAFELDIMHYLAGCACEATHKTPRHAGWRGFGYDCLRSSGSRGAVDVVAIGSSLLFVQAKISKPVISPADRRRVQGLALRAGALPLVAYRAQDVSTGRVRPHFRLLTGPGPKDWVPWEPASGDE